MTDLIEKCKVSDKRITRFSTGVFSLDVALGKGFPRGRMGMFVGKESTGKSLIALLCARSISKIDWETGEYGGFTKTLWIDVENDFDFDWAEKLGWDSRNAVVPPDNGEHACDLIKEGIDSGEYGLIVANSLDCFYPAKCEERTNEEGSLPGARAKLLNENFVKWTSQMRKLSRVVPRYKMPALLFINQYRLTIGAGMFADPRVIPGGEAQRFYNSFICSLKAAKVQDSSDVQSSMVGISGTVIKNKTYVPKKNFEFTVGLADSEELKVGEVDNFKSIMDVLKTRRIQKIKSKYQFLGEEYSTQKEIADKIKNDPEFYDKCWKLALEEVIPSGESENE